MFEEVFRKFIRLKGAFTMANALNTSEKAVYSWSMEEDSPFFRRNPLHRAVQVLDVLKRYSPELLYEVLSEIAERYGYRLEKLPAEEDIKLSKLLKEVSDVPQELIKAYEDGNLTEEEIEKVIKEIQEAQEVLAKKKAYLQWRLEQKKPIRLRRSLG
ncbi:MAG: hypothetical protein QW733_07320 [Desulfurococcaceae archaeon]